MADPTPEEQAAAALAKAQQDAADAPTKAKIKAWVKEAIGELANEAPPPKTNQPRPVSFLEGLFGAAPGDKSKSA